ncbi:hypothetical protein [Inquilinus limosus]|uniref:hypothetical protein n=1 Tax=Inquilinus limosus TaxID=171674 RepID=UPI003F5CF10A
MRAFLLMLTEIETVLVWGLVGTVALTTIMYGSQGAGLSRLSLPFLVGAWLSPDRRRAVVFGFLVYMLGGWGFALLYCWLFTLIGMSSWWLGVLAGALHALFLLTVALPVLPHLHPRMASEYDGPTAERRLEPPGFLALNYGRRTPLTTLVAHVVYGAVIGAGYTPPS